LSAPGPRPVRRIIDWILGLTLIGLGIVGGFVPVLQGWVLILAGLAVLSSHSRWARAILDRLKGLGRKLRTKIGERRSRN
jgi:uncharacterized membrane protein YbaN (DUF454 family)